MVRRTERALTSTKGVTRRRCRLQFSNNRLSAKPDTDATSTTKARGYRWAPDGQRADAVMTTLERAQWHPAEAARRPSHPRDRRAGYPGTEQQVQRCLRRYRTTTGHMPVPAPRPPSVRDMTRWIMTVDRKFVVEPGAILIVAVQGVRDDLECAVENQAG